MRSLFLLFLSIVFLQACTISENINFNKDYSGVTSYEINLKQMMELMKAQGRSKGMSGEKMNFDMENNPKFKESKDKLEEMGLKNISFSMDTTDFILRLSYEFDNINMLNKSYKNLYASQNSVQIKEDQNVMEYVDKVFKLNMPATVLTDSVKSSMSMLSLFPSTYTSTITFKSKIKSVKGNVPDLKQTKNSVTYSYALSELTDLMEKGYNLQVKLK